MSKQDRLSIDLKGLRERIDAHRSDPAWQALSLAKKIRLLIEAGLEQGEANSRVHAPVMEYKSIKQLVLRNWDKLAESPIPLERLQALRDGTEPTSGDITLLAKHLDLTEETVNQINNRGKQPNGT